MWMIGSISRGSQSTSGSLGFEELLQLFGVGLLGVVLVDDERPVLGVLLPEGSHGLLHVGLQLGRALAAGSSYHFR